MKEKASRKIFHENPYDIETLFESLTIASRNGNELLYMDRFISHLRNDPRQDITNLNYDILRELGLLKLVKAE